MIEVEVARLSAHPLSGSVFGALPEDQYADLRDDIARRGLQYPLEADQKHRVICGSQRLRAVVELGWSTVSVIYRAFDSEEDEEEHLLRDNLHRRHLTPRQVYSACRELERIEGVRARTRMGLSADGQPSRAEGRAREVVSKETGFSVSHFERLKAIYERGDRKLQEDVDAGRVSVTAAAQRVTRRTSLSKLRASPLPGDDPRAHALRLTRLRREGRRLEKYLDLHAIAEYGKHAPEARSLASAWAGKLTAWGST